MKYEIGDLVRICDSCNFIWAVQNRVGTICSRDSDRFGPYYAISIDGSVYSPFIEKELRNLTPVERLLYEI